MKNSLSEKMWCNEDFEAISALLPDAVIIWRVFKTERDQNRGLDTSSFLGFLLALPVCRPLQKIGIFIRVPHLTFLSQLLLKFLGVLDVPRTQYRVLRGKLPRMVIAV